MLYKLIDQVCSRIEQLHITNDAPEFAQQVKKANPNFLRDMKIGPVEDEEQTLQAFSTIHLSLIKSTCKMMIEPMVEKLKNEKSPLHVRYALAYSLAYLVNPNDLIPDKTPGGYGFVDDHIIIRAAFIEYLSLERSKKKAEELSTMLNFASLMVPGDVMPKLRNRVEQMGTGVQLSTFLPKEILRVMLNFCINNPLEATSEQPHYMPVGFKPVKNIHFDYNKIGHWQVDNNNIYLGGQAAIYNGQVSTFQARPARSFWRNLIQTSQH